MQRDYYQIEKMDGYYRISSLENVFSYVVVGSEKAMLIDTGYGYGDLKSAVGSITDKPLIIVNTHGHCDHTGGNAQFEEEVYIHEMDMDLCRKHTSEEMRRDNIKRAGNSVNYETGETYDALPKEFIEDAYARFGSGNFIPVSEGAVFDLGGASMEVVETPGHTRGGISLLLREKNLLFIGDAAGHFVWLFSKETTSRDVYIQALEKMYQLSADGYIGGHNPAVIQKEDFLLYIRAAKEADYKKGQPFSSFFGEEYNERVCALSGMTLEDMFKPGFAAVVINPDK